MTENRTFHPKGPALSTVLATSSTWERSLVGIEPAARIALFSVTALLLAVTIAQYFLAGALLDGTKPGLFLFGWAWVKTLIVDVTSIFPLYIALTAAHLAACILTEGYSVAGRRLQTGLGALAAVSVIALLPALGAVLLATANLVTWAAFAALVVGLIVGVIGAALGA